MTTGFAALVVHGHRDGNAVGGRPWISAECLARIRTAEGAVLRNEISHVLFSGSGAAGYPSEARQMAAAWSLPGMHVSLDEKSDDSAENVRAALRWADEIGASRILVASSWWHLRLILYYRRQKRTDLAVTHVRTRRCDRIVRHVLHEVRYLPRVVASGSEQLGGDDDFEIEANGDEAGHRSQVGLSLERHG